MTSRKTPKSKKPSTAPAVKPAVKPAVPPAVKPVQYDGLISAVYADRCLVWDNGQEYMCWFRGHLKGKQRPVVGDLVSYVLALDKTGTVTAVAPRRNTLTRKPTERKRPGRMIPPQTLACNIDQIVVVAALRDPPFRTGLLERFLVAAVKMDASALICLTKLDLDAGGEFQGIRAAYENLGYTVVGLAKNRPETLEPLAQALAGHTSILVGHSGVGKTSLLNALSGSDMAVGAVAEQTGKGQHTTTTARLIPFAGGGFAIDSPGIREFGLHGVTPLDLADYYPGFDAYIGQCGFRDCLHKGEPKCAVTLAVEAGTLEALRHHNYLKLLEEVEVAEKQESPAG